MKKILLCILIACMPAFSKSQSAWTIYNTSNSGLPFDGVNCIAFDNNGLKWIGTEFGLATFDDVSWTVYNTFNSGLPDNAIRSLLVDSANNIWIGTFLGGLVKYDGTNWTVYNDSNSDLPGNFIKALAKDTTGKIWIGTISGLVEYDGINFTVYDISNSPFELGDNIAYINIDSLNVFRIGTLNGGYIIIENGNWTVYTIPNGSGIPDNTQLEVAVDQNGVEWLATPANGLVARPGGTTWLIFNQFTSDMPTSSTTSLEVLSNPDRVWVGTYDVGIVRKTGINYVNYDSTNSPFPDVYADFIEKDASGILWIGTAAGGLVRLDESLLTGIHENPFTQQPAVFPTLTKDYVTIFYPSSGLSKIELSDISGRAIPLHFIFQSADNYVADISTLPDGIYFIRTSNNDGGFFTNKIIKFN